MGTSADSEIARQRILNAACEAFAEHGYGHATVRDICARAEVNAAAVNYHFGSKRALYAEVLRRAEPPIDPRATGAEPLDAAGRLRRFIRFFLADTFGKDLPPWSAKVLANELAAPTDLLDGLVRDAIQPHFNRLRATIAELLDAEAGPQLVDDHAFSVVAQVVFYRHSRPIIERVAERRYGPPDMERLAEHIFDAVIAALEAERSRLRLHREATDEPAQAGPRRT